MRQRKKLTKGKAQIDPNVRHPCRIPRKTAKLARRITVPLMYTIVVELAIKLCTARSVQSGKPRSARIAHTHSQLTLGKAAEMSNKVVLNIASHNIEAISIGWGVKSVLPPHACHT